MEEIAGWFHFYLEGRRICIFGYGLLVEYFISEIALSVLVQIVIHDQATEIHERKKESVSHHTLLRYGSHSSIRANNFAHSISCGIL
jgi:nitrogenase molybdenum-iron protein alpha/beta subunit